MFKLVTVCIFATVAAQSAKLAFQDAKGTCTFEKAGTTAAPYVKSSCPLSLHGAQTYIHHIGTNGHSNVANALNYGIKLGKDAGSSAATNKKNIELLKQDAHEMMNNIAADTWCNAKKMFRANMHAVRTKTSDKGLTGNKVCDNASKNVYYHGRRYKWTCVQGPTRIAPDHGTKYNLLNQHYGAPNSGNWASHYWAYSCGTTIQHPTNGPTYVCCADGDSTDTFSALEHKVNTIEKKQNDGLAKLQKELDETQSDLTKLSFDLIADVWCNAKRSFGSNMHAVRVTSSGARTGQQWCRHASRNVNYHGRKRNWNCVAGSTRIAPDFGSDYKHIGQSYGGAHRGNWASFYWAQACHHTAHSNGQTYVCCAE